MDDRSHRRLCRLPSCRARWRRHRGFARHWWLTRLGHGCRLEWRVEPLRARSRAQRRRCHSFARHGRVTRCANGPRLEGRLELGAARTRGVGRLQRGPVSPRRTSDQQRQRDGTELEPRPQRAPRPLQHERVARTPATRCRSHDGGSTARAPCKVSAHGLELVLRAAAGRQGLDGVTFQAARAPHPRSIDRRWARLRALATLGRQHPHVSGPTRSGLTSHGPARRNELLTTSTTSTMGPATFAGMPVVVCTTASPACPGVVARLLTA
jgi:hypothetical protein